MKKYFVITLLLLCSLITGAQQKKVYSLKSPDGTISVDVEADTRMLYSINCDGRQIVAPSAISLQLQNGEVLGDGAKVQSAKTIPVNTSFSAVNYRRNEIKDICNELTITCKGGYGIIFRVYNDAVAYRFFTRRKGELIILNETANFNFTGDHQAFIPIQWDYRGGQIFNSSFEALYREINLSRFPKDSLAFLPVLVDVGQGMKAEILEADLEDYPGMYLDLNSSGKGLKGVFAPYPLETKLGGYGNINVIPVKRADYIAKTSGNRSFPWRVVVISRSDKDLLNCDIVQKLASPNRITDISWIKPGQVAWDWWNDWNISHVDFRAGINTPTYKYYIDFASDNKIPYIILDAGWTNETDLTVPIPEVDLKELVAYGKQKNVGLILWASWYSVTQQKAKAFPFFESLGIKGLKIDFIDRDDQLAVASLYEIAKEAAGYHLLVDYHGVFKPAGLQRTFPNVVGIEGVKGMENVKWANEDVPRYDVTLPFIRNLAGPMDYTPGAMRNATQSNFKPSNSMPMSKGTRVHQMAMYVVFEVPLQMLSDNPTAYRKEQECTDFITKVPTTFDETVPLDGQVAEFVSVARRKGDTWFVGAMTSWTPRELTIDFSFLPEGNYQAEIFRDGVNADRDASDYKKEVIPIQRGDKLPVKLMNGGGWVARIERVNSFSQSNGLVEKSEPWDRISQGEYLIENVTWNVQAAKSPWTETIYCDTIKDTMGWRWDFSKETDKPENYTVKSFPEIIYGHKPYKGYSSTTSRLPAALNTSQFILDYEYTASADGIYNTSTDISFTDSKNPGESNIRAKLMIWFDQQNMPFYSPEKLKQVVIDEISYKIYIDTTHTGPEGKWNLIALLPDHFQSTGKLNLQKYIDFLLDAGALERGWYLSSIEAGSEIASGKGEVVFKKFAVHANSIGGLSNAKTN